VCPSQTYLTSSRLQSDSFSGPEGGEQGEDLAQFELRSLIVNFFRWGGSGALRPRRPHACTHACTHGTCSPTPCTHPPLTFLSPAHPPSERLRRALAPPPLASALLSRPLAFAALYSYLCFLAPLWAHPLHASLALLANGWMSRHSMPLTELEVYPRVRGRRQRPLSCVLGRADAGGWVGGGCVCVCVLPAGPGGEGAELAQHRVGDQGAQAAEPLQVGGRRGRGAGFSAREVRGTPEVRRV
jgi:hypothetical protein